MNRLLMSAVAATILLGAPIMASAADTMKADKPATMATMMCRAATGKEKSMTGVTMMGKTAVVCKTITPAMMQKMQAGPAISASMNAAQVNDAWKKFMEESVFAL